MSSFLDDLLKNIGNTGKNVGNFVGSTATTIGKDVSQGVNQGLGSIQLAGNKLDQAAALALGKKQLAQKFANQQTMLNQGKGLFGLGGIHSAQQFQTENPLQALNAGAQAGVHYAPYFVGGGGGALTAKLGTTVAGKVGTGIIAKTLGQGARIGANAAISAPVFGGLNAVQQGIDSGFTKFDPGQSNVAGGQAALMTAAGDLAPIAGKYAIKGAAKGTKAATQAAAKAIDDTTIAAHNKLVDHVASSIGDNYNYHQSLFEPSLIKNPSPENLKGAEKYYNELAKGNDIGRITTTTNANGFHEPETQQGLQKYLAYRAAYEDTLTPNTINDFSGVSSSTSPYSHIPSSHVDAIKLRQGIDAIKSQKQGGYIRLPGGGIDDVGSTFSHDMVNEAVASAKSPEEYKQSLIDSIYNENKKGNGVNLVKNDAGNGFTNAKRISDNNPFYSAYYKQYGKAPTRKAIADMVNQTLTGNKGEYDASLLGHGYSADELAHHQDVYQQLKDRQDGQSNASGPTTEPQPVAKKVSTPIKEAPQTSQFPTASAAKRTLNDYKKNLADINAQIETNGATKDLTASKEWYTTAVKEAKSDLNKYWKEEAKKPEPIIDKRPAAADTKTYLKDLQKSQKDARTKSTTGLERFKNDFNTKLVDSFHPIESKVNKAVKQGADIPLSNNITNKIDRALRADTIAGQFIKDNGLAKIIQKVDNTKEFDQYVIAKHAQDLAREGVVTGRNAASDRQLIKDLAPKYEAHAQALNDYSRTVLNKAVDYGLVKKEVAEGLKKKYPNYVPFNRIFGEDELTQVKGIGGGKVSKSTQTVVQKIKGSEREIESPLASFAAKTKDVIQQGEVNQAAKTLASYKDLPGNPLQLRELGKDEMIGTKHTISYLDNGVKRTFETTPEIEAAAKSLNKEQMNIVGKMFAIPTRALRLGATGVNVGFTLANVAKDMASAFLNSNHPLQTSALNMKVLGKSVTAALNHNSKAYGELVREGAGGTSFDVARDAPKQTVSAIRGQGDVLSKVTYTVTHPSQYIRAIENTIGRGEEVTRAMQYFGNKSGGLKRGLSEADARTYGAMAARTNTVNFARGGDYAKAANTLLPYLNAGIQGARTFSRNLKERPVQTMAKYAVIGAMPVATLTVWNMSDPKRRQAYEDISDTEKQGNFILVPPNPVKDPKTGRWNVIKVPVSQEIASLNNIVRNGVETAYGDNKSNVGNIAGNLGNAVTSFNLQDPRQLLGQAIPQALKPGIETMTNKNLYTGNAVVPDSQKNLPAAEQYGQNTSGTAKTLGTTLGLSPRTIDNAIQTGLGGAGQTLINTSDNALAALGIISPNDVKGKDIPSSVSTRFIGANSIPTSTKIQQQFDTTKKQLMGADLYKNADQQTRANLLNSLQTDLSAVNYNAADNQPGSTYKATPLTKNQQLLQNGDISAYLDAKSTSVAKKVAGLSPSSTGPKISPNLDKSSSSILQKYSGLTASARASAFNNDNTAQYQYDLANYQNKKASGTLSQAQDIRAQYSLAKEQVGSSYPKQVRDLYSLTPSQLANISDKSVVNQVIAYGDALQNAGVTTKNKFRSSTGSVTLTKRTSTRKAATVKPIKNTAVLSAFKTAKNVKLKKVSSGTTRAKGLIAYKKPAQAKQFKA